MRFGDPEARGARRGSPTMTVIGQAAEPAVTGNQSAGLASTPPLTRLAGSAVSRAQDAPGQLCPERKMRRVSDSKSARCAGSAQTRGSVLVEEPDGALGAVDASGGSVVDVPVGGEGLGDGVGLAFTGHHEPHLAGAVEGGEREGDALG